MQTYTKLLTCFLILFRSIALPEVTPQISDGRVYNVYSINQQQQDNALIRTGISSSSLDSVKTEINKKDEDLQNSIFSIMPLGIIIGGSGLLGGTIGWGYSALVSSAARKAALNEVFGETWNSVYKITFNQFKKTNGKIVLDAILQDAVKKSYEKIFDNLAEKYISEGASSRVLGGRSIVIRPNLGLQEFAGACLEHSKQGILDYKLLVGTLHENNVFYDAVNEAWSKNVRTDQMAYFFAHIVDGQYGADAIFSNIVGDELEDNLIAIMNNAERQADMGLLRRSMMTNDLIFQKNAEVRTNFFPSHTTIGNTQDMRKLIFDNEISFWKHEAIKETTDLMINSIEETFFGEAYSASERSIMKRGLFPDIYHNKYKSMLFGAFVGSLAGTVGCSCLDVFFNEHPYVNRIHL